MNLGSDLTSKRHNIIRRGSLRSALDAAAIATLAVGIACAATGIAQAQPAAAPAIAASSDPVSSIRGIESGISYFARITPNGGGVATTLDAGTFAMSAEANAITIADRSGTVVGAVPLAIHAAGRDIALDPAIEDDGATLTLRPTAAPAQATRVGATLTPGSIDAPAQAITSQERWNEQVQRGTFGALIGGAIGGLITIPFWIFVLPPLLGIAIGAGIGFLAVGGQPLLDAGIAYFTGQP